MSDASRWATVRATAAVLLALCVATQGKPHIVLWVVDDLGYADHELYGASDIATPHLLAAAAEGVTLDNYYTQTVCSPTRAALMTGIYPSRLGMQHSTTLFPGGTAHLPLDVPTLPELLKLQGYATAMLGKWHLGYAAWRYTPTGRGFDEFLGYLQGQEDYFDKSLGLKGDSFRGFDFWRNRSVARDGAGAYSLNQYMAQFDDVLARYAAAHADAAAKAAHPLFLYFSLQTVHLPLQSARPAGEAACAGIEDKWRRVYCSMLVEADDALGRAVAKLKALGMWEDTLFVISTDNGGMVRWGEAADGSPTWPASAGSNHPLRAGKTALFEGGVRATGVVTGGAADVAKGTRYKGLMHVVDVAAVALAAAGASIVAFPGDAIPGRVALDGMDLLPSILAGLEDEASEEPRGAGNASAGNANASAASAALPRRNDVLINLNYEGKKYSAIRFGKYKLIVGTALILPTDGYFPLGAGKPEPAPAHSGPHFLFDLEADPSEREDLSAALPEQVDFGLDLIHKYKATGYRAPQPNLPHVRGLPNFHGGVWAPFLRDEEAAEPPAGTLEHAHPDDAFAFM